MATQSRKLANPTRQRHQQIKNALSRNGKAAELANLERAEAALEKASTFPEVKAIRDMAETARGYAIRAHKTRVVQLRAAELALQAARKAGKILKQLEKTKPQSAAKRAGDSEYRKALNETETPDRTARHWQRLARVPDHITQRYFARVRKTEKEEITAAGLVREATKKARAVAGASEFSPEERKAFLETGRLGIFHEDMLEDYSKIKDLAEKFGASPFSIFDLKQGSWLKRLREWKALGITGEAGRGEQHNPVYESKSLELVTDTLISIFHPALTEIIYSWFAPKGAHILDPFAGGSTRGIVAAFQGHKYTGIELRAEQIEENRKQVEKVQRNDILSLPRDFGHESPKWIEGDSAELSTLIKGQEFDLIFTCPPYYNLEEYTEADDRDLSRCPTYEEFIRRYEGIFRQAIQHLKPDRFAVVVVGEIRDKKTGWFYNFVGDTVSCVVLPTNLDSQGLFF